VVAETATDTTQNKHKRTTRPSAGFEPAIPSIKRPQTYASDRTANGIGPHTVHWNTYTLTHKHTYRYIAVFVPWIQCCQLFAIFPTV